MPIDVSIALSELHHEHPRSHSGGSAHAPFRAIALSSVLATYHRSAGSGTFNRARYSNPTLDKALAAANASFDAQQRERLLEQAAEAGFKDVGIVPLYFPENFWATRNGITFTANKAESTSATYAGSRQK